MDRILEDVQSFFVDDEGYDFGTSCKASFTWKRKFIHLYLESTADLLEFDRFVYCLCFNGSIFKCCRLLPASGGMDLLKYFTFIVISGSTRLSIRCCQLLML